MEALILVATNVESPAVSDAGVTQTQFTDDEFTASNGASEKAPEPLSAHR